jgi:hypothetical protein
MAHFRVGIGIVDFFPGIFTVLGSLQKPSSFGLDLFHYDLDKSGLVFSG